MYYICVSAFVWVYLGDEFAFIHIVSLWCTVSTSFYSWSARNARRPQAKLIWERIEWNAKCTMANEIVR